MSLYSDSFKNADVNIRFNFNSFSDALLTAFSVCTRSNWNDIFSAGALSEVGVMISAFYFITLLFIGHYILMNLIFAMIIEGFTSRQTIKDMENLQV